MDVTFSSAVVILLLVIDPVGNIPIFVVALRGIPAKRRARIVVRECLIALGVLIVMALVGKPLLELLGLSDRSLNIAGGVILFLISLRMIFRSAEGIFGDTRVAGEPFIVPLAIPAMSGPTAIATVMLFVSRHPERLFEWLLAIALAMILSIVVLVFAERISKRIGERGLVALERLMGLLLTAVAVEMLLRGIEGFVQLLRLSS
ncbi:MAG TPA: MarC family protein [Burkholderiales bacterium]|nr:MarC family protein [Burkholderiales bacterium]